MRILSWPEVAKFNLGELSDPLPHEYGKYFWAWVWDREEPLAYRGRSVKVYSDSWRQYVERLGCKGMYPVHCPRLSNTDAKVLRSKTEVILPVADERLRSIAIPGFIYLRLAKPKEKNWDEWSRGNSGLVDEPVEGSRDDADRHASRSRRRTTEAVRSEPAPPPRGEIIDLEFFLDAREVPALTGEQHWVLETWFEHPPGFVWETGQFLEKELGKQHEFVKSYRELVYGRDECKRKAWLERIEGRNHEAAKLSLPPLKPLQLVGPDEHWRYCANPYWVQTILMARLIGGPFWTYVYGALEALHGKVTDWQTLG